MAPTHDTHTTTDPSTRRWRWIAMALALSQLAAPLVANALAGDFLKRGATNQALITPAGYAFSLWGLITLCCAVTMIAVVRYGLGAWWETAALVDASVVFVGFSVWLLMAAQNWYWVSVVVFVVMVSGLLHIMRLLVRRRHDLSCPSWLATLTTATFGLYLGWSSIAVFANVAVALISDGVSPSIVLWQLVVLISAALFAIAVTTMLNGTLGYVAGVLWALVAIAIGASQRGSTVLSATAIAAAITVLGVAALALLRRRKARPAVT